MVSKDMNTDEGDNCSLELSEFLNEEGGPPHTGLVVNPIAVDQGHGDLRENMAFCAQVPAWDPAYGTDCKHQLIGSPQRRKVLSCQHGKGFKGLLAEEKENSAFEDPQGDQRRGVSSSLNMFCGLAAG